MWNLRRHVGRIHDPYGKRFKLYNKIIYEEEIELRLKYRKNMILLDNIEELNFKYESEMEDVARKWIHNLELKREKEQEQEIIRIVLEI